MTKAQTLAVAYLTDFLTRNFHYPTIADNSITYVTGIGEEAMITVAESGAITDVIGVVTEHYVSLQEWQKAYDYGLPNKT